MKPNKDRWVAQRLTQPTNYPIIDIDGVRVKFAEGWGLLRASNTGPILVMRFEASSEERLEEYRGLVEGILKGVS